MIMRGGTMEYVIGIIVFLIFAFVCVLIEDAIEGHYWKKRCSECGLKPYHCVRCRRFNHIMRNGG
jgi:hypothetical protein